MCSPRKVKSTFFNKIWRYYGRPTKKKYSFSGIPPYASGQRLCMCEAYWDTLVWVGSVAVSSKRLGLSTIEHEDGTQTTSTYNHFPTGSSRDYYGGFTPFHPNIGNTAANMKRSIVHTIR